MRAFLQLRACRAPPRPTTNPLHLYRRPVTARLIPSSIAPTTGTGNDIAAFFASYPEFQYEPDNGALSEWRRLCRSHLVIDPENKILLVRETGRELRTAMVLQFNSRYGTDANSLSSWQLLCLKVDIPVRDTIKECEEVRICCSLYRRATDIQALWHAISCTHVTACNHSIFTHFLWHNRSGKSVGLIFKSFFMCFRVFNSFFK